MYVHHSTSEYPFFQQTDCWRLWSACERNCATSPALWCLAWINCSYVKFKWPTLREPSITYRADREISKKKCTVMQINYSLSNIGRYWSSTVNQRWSSFLPPLEDLVNCSSRSHTETPALLKPHLLYYKIPSWLLFKMKMREGDGDLYEIEGGRQYSYNGSSECVFLCASVTAKRYRAAWRERSLSLSSFTIKRNCLSENFYWTK